MKPVGDGVLRCYLSFTIEGNVVTQISFQALNKISCTEDVLTRTWSKEPGGSGEAGGGGGWERGSCKWKTGKKRIGPKIKAQKGKRDCGVSLKCQPFVFPVYHQTIHRLL